MTPVVGRALAVALPSTAQVERVADPNWTHPRTPDRQADLQGMWGNKTTTPMERPESVEGRAFLTPEEISTLEAQRAVRNALSGQRALDAHGETNQEQ